MKYSIEEILDNTSGYIFYKSPHFNKDIKYTTFSIGSSINNFDKVIFIPLYVYINENLTDSFLKIETYLKQGVRAFMFDEKMFYETQYRDILFQLIRSYRDTLDCVIMVKDTKQAILDLANYTKSYKLSKNIKYIAVTGSVGKTSTTQLVHTVLSQKYKIYGQAGENLRIRIANKFLEIDENPDYFLCECTGAVSGHLKYFSELLTPRIAVITNIAPIHINGDETILDVANRKSEIFESMSEGSYAVLYHEMECFDIVREQALKRGLKIITFGENNADILIHNDGENRYVKVQNNIYHINEKISKHKMFNIAAALSVAYIEGLDINDSLISKLADQEPVKGRGDTSKIKINGKKVTIINEAFNANLLSMKAVLEDYANQIIEQENKVLVLGDMKECGRQSSFYHLELEKYINKIMPDRIFFCGEDIKILYKKIKSEYYCFYYQNYMQMNEEIIDRLKDNDVILFKASHSVGLEKVIKFLQRKSLNIQPPHIPVKLKNNAGHLNPDEMLADHNIKLY